MQETDADGALAGTDVLGRAGAGLGVNFDVLVEVYQVLDAFIMSILLDHGIDDQLRGTRGVVVGQPDQALVLGIKQILPVLRSLDALALQIILVDHEAQDTLVNAVPVTIRVTVCRGKKVACVLGFIRLEQALARNDIVRIGGAAEPDVCGRIAVLFLDLSLDFTGGQTLILYLDAVQLLEILAGCCQVILLAGAVNDQRTFCLGSVH